MTITQKCRADAFCAALIFLSEFRLGKRILSNPSVLFRPKAQKATPRGRKREKMSKDGSQKIYSFATETITFSPLMFHSLENASASPEIVRESARVSSQISALLRSATASIASEPEREILM